MKRLFFIVALFPILLLALPAFSAEIIQLPGVIHLHSTFSSGNYSIEQMVNKARQKNLEVLIITDHDLVVMEYGLFPLRNLIKRREERRSIQQAGPHKFLQAIGQINNRQKDVIVIPGAQSSPFYYWTGSPFKKNLVAHDYRKEILLVGMNSAEDYANLPRLHAGLTIRHTTALLPRTLFFLVPLSLGIFFIFRKGVFRIPGFMVCGFSLLLLLNHHPFQSSTFDPYHGSQGIAPYQEVIDHVTQRNGLVFWAHPESNYSKGGVKLGPVILKTEHYPDALLRSQNYTGFSCIYGDNETATAPGKQWDQALVAYCRGERGKPVWGIAGADFHYEEIGVALDTFQTVFLAAQKTPAAVMEARASGRVYAIRKGNDSTLKLERFSIREKEGDQSVMMGQDLMVNKDLVVEGGLTLEGSEEATVDIFLIRNGQIWQNFSGQVPLKFRFVDTEQVSGKSFYRLDVRSRTAGRLVSNPIFVTRNL